jgi:soluble lytic murein transglycosylase
VRAADLVRRARDLERRAAPTDPAAAPEGAAPGSTTAAPGAGTPAATASATAAADSARQAYEAAAELAPDVADWLRLRAAALTVDSTARAGTLAAVATPAARERALLADAAARLRAGDAAGAAAAYEAAGRPAAALGARLRLTPPGVTGRDAVRAALLRLAGAAPDSDSTRIDERPVAETPAERARIAALLLDSAFAPLPAADQLVVARALRTTRDPATRLRAAAAHAAALAGGQGDARDQHAYATLLVALRRWREAAAAYARVPAASALAPDAAYQRARALLRAGDAAGARAAVDALAAAAPRDSAAAAARYALAEWADDGGADDAARGAYLAIARDHPVGRWGAAASYRAGVLALAGGDARGAADAFAQAAARAPSTDVAAARYWAGRAAAALGDSGRARAWWESAASVDPGSYYAWLAARRLGRAAWAPADRAALPADPTAAAVARRAALCERVGLMPEAGWERGWLVAWAEGSPARMATAGAALVATARPGPGIRLGLRAVARGADTSAALWRVLYPLPYAEPVAREARAAGVDPVLAAALIKQESNFTADAVSPAGARGMMQVMPDVGRALWRGPGAWDAALLFRPDVNLALGMRHLDDALGRWPDPAYALAAYNAGASRVRRWQTQRGAGDPELFAERIPFVETRDYVRIVLRNREFYRALYPVR